MTRRKKKSIDTAAPRNRTKVPLTSEEIERVKKVARELHRYQGVDVYHCVMIMLYTGMHPTVLADIRKSRLRRVGNDLEWFRPKKKGLGALTSVPIYHELEPWIDEFIHSDLPTYRNFYWYLVKVVGVRADIPELSPMSLRHTFGCILDDYGFTAAEIMHLMNCSYRTLMTYTSRTRKNIEDKMTEIGWTAEDVGRATVLSHALDKPPEKKPGKDCNLSFYADNMDWWLE